MQYHKPSAAKKKAARRIPIMIKSLPLEQAVEQTFRLGKALNLVWRSVSGWTLANAALIAAQASHYQNVHSSNSERYYNWLNQKSINNTR